MNKKIGSVLASIISGLVLGQALNGSTPEALAICQWGCSNNCILSVYWCVQYTSGDCGQYYFTNTPGGNGVSVPQGTNCVNSNQSDVSGDNYKYQFTNNCSGTCNCISSNGTKPANYVFLTGGKALGYEKMDSTFMIDTCAGSGSSGN